MSETKNTYKQKPVIFLAFANDKGDLRKLSHELREVRGVLDKAKKSNHCEVVERANATIEDILDVFQDETYKNRIAIFHYGGHANDYQLLLESLNGGHESAHREGLVSYLARQARQGGLQFVFFNGCSTQQHAIELIQAGVPAVVGTSQSIADDVAADLSIRFYNGIANGFSLERAWKEAVDFIKIQKGTSNFRDLYWKGKQDIEDRFPWDIFYRDGSEKVKEWNLPTAARDPLFGLPILPKGKLPEEPFLYLQRYEKKHAEIFFGRSYYIRKLYDRVTDKNSSPIILLYGQSGVGKSSLLEAGLFPRLEQNHMVCYARRDPDKGLRGTLETALHDLLSQLSTETVEDSEGNHEISAIAEKWKRIESQTGKSLVVLLDQAEEVFTRYNKELPSEWDDFLEELKPIFENPGSYPKGKLILGYRKEYHPDIKEKFKQHKLDRRPLFMKPLDRADIIDVVTGLTRTQRLRDKYNLVLVDKDKDKDKNLPVIIADDLLEDPNTPVAPVLQIILTRMWQAQEDEFNEVRYFTVEQYRALRKEGILVEDFFHQEMEKLREWKAEVVDSGLALDMLKSHTTEMGTARARMREELRRDYRHRLDVLDEMTEKLKFYYLLTAAYTDAKRKDETSLAHDTLAPVVIKEYSNSDKPGQRASRILAAKVEDFKKYGHKISLYGADLEIVEQGKNGMRALDDKEEKLLQYSRELKAQREKEKRVLHLILEAKRKVKEDPTAALRIAEEAWKLDKNKNVTDTIYDIYDIYAENSFYKIIAKHEDTINCVAFSPDGNTILTGSGDKTARLWDRQGNMIREFKGHTDHVNSVAFSPDGNTILTGSWDNTARLWDRQGSMIQEFKWDENVVSSVAFSPDGKSILTGSEGLFGTVEKTEDTARLWDRQGNIIQKFIGHTKCVSSVAFSPDGNTILTGSEDQTARLWDLQGNVRQEFKGHEGIVTSVAFSPDGNTILTGSKDETARLWDHHGKVLQEFTGHTKCVSSVAFSPDGNTILTGSWDNTARLWDRQGYMIQDFKGHTSSVDSVAFSPDGNTILTGSRDNTSRLWDRQGSMIQEFKGHTDTVTSVDFSPDGNTILTGSEDQTARLWDLQGNVRQEFKGHISAVFSVAFSPDGNTILTGSCLGTVRLLDLRGNVRQEFEGHEGIITSVAFSPDGNTILTGSWDKTARLWDRQGNMIQEFKGHEFMVTSVAFSPDGKFILTGSGGHLGLGDNTGQLWDHHGKILQEFKGHEFMVTSVAFSPDGNTILTGSEDETARLWDHHGKVLQEFKGHTDIVTSAAFSPDGNTILTGSRDNTARLWNPRGKFLQEFKGHIGKVTSVAFSPDGNTILTGSNDNTARLWKVPMSLENFLKDGNLEPLNDEQKKEFGIKD
jgi:WD40 repeat protein